MQIGMIGLGRMGANIARRLMRHGHSTVVYDQTAAAMDEVASDGAAAAKSIDALIKQLTPPRAVWVMLPAGEATETTIARLGELLAAGDTVIDGGNTFWRDDLRRAQALKKRGIHHVDAGTSGGVLGRESGYCLMIGGEAEIVKRLAAIFLALSPGADDKEKKSSPAEQGWLHVGPNGAGHFVKMIHNGIEYGLMQAYAEGFQILKETDAAALPEAERFTLDIAAIAEAVAARQHRLVATARRDRGGTARRRSPQGIFRHCQRHRRRPLDGDDRDRAGNPCDGADHRAQRPLPLAAREQFRRQSDFGHAARFRRPYRNQRQALMAPPGRPRSS